MRIILVLIMGLGFLVSSSVAQGSMPESAQLVEARKIWDKAPHNAFTDLIYFKGRWLCAFREGEGHVSQLAGIRVIESRDGAAWQSAALIEAPGYDLRDAKISATGDGRRLMLMGAAAVREGTQPATKTRSFVSFSSDGRRWSSIAWVGTEDRWLWRVTWHRGKAYGVDYGVAPAARAARAYTTALLESKDGKKYRTLVPELYGAGGPTEATLRFASDDTLFCLQRRDGTPNSALLGRSRPPYTAWDWNDLGSYLGGPNFIQLPDGRWIAGGRMRVEGQKPESKTVVCRLDMEKPALILLLILPSGGDTSYPGLVWHGGLLWVSYYSSHEGRTSIYLAKVKLP